MKTVNMILYCERWEQAVRFYREALNLPVLFAGDWFVEFRLSDSARVSIADERRASIKSSHGRGVTLALEVDDIDSVRKDMEKKGLAPTPLRNHPWNARVFYLFDPEGHRIEIWQAGPAEPSEKSQSQ